jgi:hypothetical protein
MAKAGWTTARNKWDKHLIDRLQEDGVIVVSGYVSPHKMTRPVERPVDRYFLPSASKFTVPKPQQGDLNLRVNMADLYKASGLDFRKKYTVIIIPSEKVAGGLEA